MTALLVYSFMAISNLYDYQRDKQLLLVPINQYIFSEHVFCTDWPNLGVKTRVAANTVLQTYSSTPLILKPQSHRIVRFCDRTIGCDLVSYDRSAMFAAISFCNRTLWCILYDWL